MSFLHYYLPQAILFSFGPINIYWYGFFIAGAIFSALTATVLLAKNYNISKNTIIDLAFWLIIAGIIGARIYAVFLEFDYYLANPLNIFKIWQGGLAIHGAIIGGVLTLWYLIKKYKLDFWLLCALSVPGLALGQAIGRWGNYFNQELFGLPTDKAWGIPIAILNRPKEYIANQYFHPTFLYESLGNFLIFLILISFHVFVIKKKKISLLTNKIIFSSYLILYSVLRFLMEFLRIDKTPEIFSLRWPQIISLLLIITAVIIVLGELKKRKYIKNNA